MGPSQVPTKNPSEEILGIPELSWSVRPGATVTREALKRCCGLLASRVAALSSWTVLCLHALPACPRAQAWVVALHVCAVGGENRIVPEAQRGDPRNLTSGSLGGLWPLILPRCLSRGPGALRSQLPCARSSRLECCRPAPEGQALH